MQNTHLGDLIDELWDLRERKRKIEGQFKAKLAPIEKEMSEIEQKLWKAMKEAGTDRAGGERGSYKYSETPVFIIEDYNRYAAWIVRTGNVHCLERRPAQKALREVAAHKRGGKIPGLKQVDRPGGVLSTLGSRK